MKLSAITTCCLVGLALVAGCATTREEPQRPLYTSLDAPADSTPEQWFGEAPSAESEAAVAPVIPFDDETTEGTTPTASPTSARATIRGQSPSPPLGNPVAPGSDDRQRYPMRTYGEPVTRGQSPYGQQPSNYAQQLANPYNDAPPAGTAYQQYPNNYATPPGTSPAVQPANTYPPPSYVSQPAPGQPVPYGNQPPIGSGVNDYVTQTPGVVGPQQPGVAVQPFPGVLQPGQIAPAFEPVDPQLPSVDLDVFVDEERTGRFMFGAGVNSDLGVTGQIVIDERNFDWRAVPTSVDDIIEGRAFRGGGQGFRIEAMPGTQFQRYMFSFTQPYLYLGTIPTPFSYSLSGFYFDRRYFDWDENRLGGRMALGYRVTHDLSLSGAIRAEQVEVKNLRLPGLVPQLDSVVGENSLYSGRVTLTHDTRDRPFIPTEGHMIELSYEQVFGDFDYPRVGIDLRKYFLMRERPDGSGRHTLGYSFKVGVSGSQTPVFEHYFAGGFSTMRGFDFRGASPVEAGVVVGGEFQFLGSVEYMFPLTADDMVKGVVFCDYGTVEPEIDIDGDSYRIAPGVGLRISIPAMGPAPLALDLAFPVNHAATDDIQNFSFFFGFGR